MGAQIYELKHISGQMYRQTARISTYGTFRQEASIRAAKQRRKACIGESRLPCVFGSSARGRIDSYYLLVVDEKCPAELSFVRFWKQRAEWVVVGEAFNGRHAIETVDEYLPHITVIDFVMPEMDGLEAARQLIRRNTAIVILL